jgi:hypothetical protein
MTNEQFQQWFMEHLDEMVSVGIVHYNSEAARWVKLALTASSAQISQLEARIAALESKPKRTRKKKVDG